MACGYPEQDGGSDRLELPGFICGRHTGISREPPAAHIEENDTIAKRPAHARSDAEIAVAQNILPNILPRMAGLPDGPHASMPNRNGSLSG
jgi:hypothetical protein